MQVAIIHAQETMYCREKLLSSRGLNLTGKLDLRILELLQSSWDNGIHPQILREPADVTVRPLLTNFE